MRQQEFFNLILCTYTQQRTPDRLTIWGILMDEKVSLGETVIPDVAREMLEEPKV